MSLPTYTQDTTDSSPPPSYEQAMARSGCTVGSADEEKKQQKKWSLPSLRLPWWKVTATKTDLLPHEHLRDLKRCPCDRTRGSPPGTFGYMDTDFMPGEIFKPADNESRNRDHETARRVVGAFAADAKTRANELSVRADEPWLSETPEDAALRWYSRWPRRFKAYATFRPTLGLNITIAACATYYDCEQSGDWRGALNPLNWALVYLLFLPLSAMIVCMKHQEAIRFSEEDRCSVSDGATPLGLELLAKKEEERGLRV